MKWLPEIDMDFIYRLSWMRNFFQDGRYFFAPLAQLAKHSTFNQVAVGSNPTWGMTAWI